MIDLQLIYEGGGRFRTATKLDLAITGERFGAGEVLEARVGKKRSIPQLRWFFAMVRAAFDNQSTGPTFDDEERLRKWLLIRAGHCNVKRFEPGALTREFAAWLRETYQDVDITHDGKWIYVKTARSIARTAVASVEMTAIANKVVEIIMAEIVPGSTWDDWKPYIDAGREKPRKSKQPA